MKRPLRAWCIRICGVVAALLYATPCSADGLEGLSAMNILVAAALTPLMLLLQGLFLLIAHKKHGLALALSALVGAGSLVWNVYLAGILESEVPAREAGAGACAWFGGLVALLVLSFWVGLCILRQVRRTALQARPS